MLRRVLPLILALGCGQNREKPDQPPPPPSARPDASAADLAAAHSDHSPRHGGVVLMDGDLHFEAVLGPDGTHAVHFTDAVRRPLPPTVASRVTITIDRGEGTELETIALAPGADAWRGKGQPITGPAVARVAYDAPGKAKPYHIDINLGGATKAKTAKKGQRDRDGRVELHADRTGAFRLTLLDEEGQPRAPTGVTATVDLELKGHDPVTLSAAGEHLEGRGQDIDHDHATAVVTLTENGKTATARVNLHLEADDPILRAYDQIHAALAADSLADVPRAALALEKSARGARQDAVAAAAARLAEARDLPTARARFGDLSREVIRLVEAEPHRAGDHQVYECPMVREGFNRWLQPGAAARNPYYGSEMLTCGQPLP